MDEILKQSLLYDFYGELLTEHQKEIYEQFIVEDLSLSEIAKDAGISRQGVHDLVKRCDKILEEYEAKLHLVEKFLSLLLIKKTERLSSTIISLVTRLVMLLNSTVLSRMLKVTIRKLHSSFQLLALKNHSFQN